MSSHITLIIWLLWRSKKGKSKCIACVKEKVSYLITSHEQQQEFKGRETL